MLKVSFLGSSDDSYIYKYKKEVSNIIDTIFEISDTVLVMNGGYQGLMKFIGEETIRISSVKKKQVFIQGNLFNGYKNDTSRESIYINSPNKVNDSIITSTSIGDRAQSMISIADVIIALPGKSGTLHEILQTIEHIKYGMNYNYENDFKLLYLHNYWSRTFSSLYLNKIFSSEIKKHLNFFKCKYPKDIDDFQRLLLNNTNSGEKNNSIQIYLNTQNYLGTELKVDCKFDSNHSRQGVYESFVYRINRLIKLDYENDFNKNCFLGFDIVIRKVEDQKLLSLKTFGTKSYADLLQSFLNKYNSILLNNSYIKDHKNIVYFNIINNTSKTNFEFSQEFMFVDNLLDLKLSVSSKKKKNSEIATWIDHLYKSEYGKTLIWLNKEVLNGQYNISCFLLLDIFSTDTLNIKLKNEIENFILNEVIEEIVILDKNIITNHATQAAISQIFARNMSHNIGSHVLSRMIHSDQIKELVNKHEIIREVISTLYN